MTFIRISRRTYQRLRKQNQIMGLVILAQIAILVLVLIFYRASPENANMETVDVLEAVPVKAMTLSTVSKPVFEPVTYSKDWDSEDGYLLAKIAMAEAEGEPLKGKELVILVVLNRVRSRDFPNSIEEVLYQPQQFSCMTDGRWDETEPNEDCWEAVSNVQEMTHDISDGALYFESCKSDCWQSRNLEYLFQVGNHKFYK